MAAPAWLTARPIAHRGLHDRAEGRIENTLQAAAAAIAHGFPIECDVQLTKDGEVIVFHDDTIDRLTTSSGPVKDLTLPAINALTLQDSADHIPTLDSFLQLLGGRVPLICEIKSHFNGDMALTNRTCSILASYEGPVAIISFDPAIIAAVRNLAPNRPRGFVGESIYDDPEWDFLIPSQKRDMAGLFHLSDMQPDFLSWYVKDLEHPGPMLGRQALGLPLMTWTVRTEEDKAMAARYADQIVFEGFIPETRR